MRIRCDLAADGEDLCRTATHRYIIVMLTLFPLFTWTDGYVFVQDEKYYFFLIWTGLWLLALTAGTVRLVKTGAPAPVTSCEVLLLVFMACCILSAICVPARTADSLDSGNHNGLSTWLLYAAVVLGVARFGEAKRCYIHVLGAAYSICIVVVLLQLLGFNALWLYPWDLNYYSPEVVEMGRFLGTVGNVDLMSEFHCLSIPVLAACGLFGSGRERILLLPVFFGVVCAVWAGVSSGLLALCVTTAAAFPLAVFWFQCMYRGLDRRRARHISFAAACAVAAVCVAGVAAVYVAPVESGTIYELKSLLHGTIKDEFGSSRIAIWKECIRVFLAHPVFGIGPDRLLDYSWIEFSRYSEVLGETIRSVTDDAHNVYLQMLLNFGLVGFVPFAALVAVLWGKILRSRETSGVLAVLGPAVLCYMVQAFFNISSCITMPLACILMGLVFSVDTGREVQSA